MYQKNYDIHLENIYVEGIYSLLISILRISMLDGLLFELLDEHI